MSESKFTMPEELHRHQHGKATVGSAQPMRSQCSVGRCSTACGCRSSKQRVNCGSLSATWPQGCIRREGTSEAAPESVGQAVGGGCQSGWGRLLSVTNAVEPGTCRQGDSGWA